MFPNWSVTNFIHLIELSLEEYEITAGLWLFVNQTSFKLFKSVNDFEEIAMVKEEVEVFTFRLLYNSFNWDKQSFLIKVLFEIIRSISLKSK